MNKFKKQPLPLCRCGCGRRVKKSQNYKGWNKFVHGHNSRINNPMKGKNHTKEYRKSMIGNQRGKGNKGSRDYKCTDGERKARSKRMSGKNNPMYGKGHLITGTNNPMYRGSRPDEWRKIQSKFMLAGGAAHANSFITSPSQPQVQLYELVKLLYPDAILNHSSLNYSIDIAIPEQMIAIEYDGSYWHQDKKADNRRQKQLEAIGWKFLRYCNYVPSIKELKGDLFIIKRRKGWAENHERPEV